MIDINDLLGGLGFIGVVAYGAVSLLSTLLVVGIELWVLWNFFDLLTWAEQFGMVTLPLKAGIAVVALAGLGIAVPAVIITLLIIASVGGVLYNKAREHL